ncbi:hypothetical protein JNUCC1_03519 [Lentibacillus sp. JNUCC-1]|uniref:hypothetical protein n=1 Tax=Lentibacillus sp. JNUCC-1 TaxID=2654513 RepID=UPI0013297241|nr:hypothetical protein [Lentibacillus sp. JNUCC-1]MUV39635.1 hypothetical protein [Lentibacillus sp. JNUCC-1]
MRIIAMAASVLILAGVIYKWRYRIMNMLLAVGVLRHLAISFTMKMPQIRNKMLPALFK